MKRSNSRDLVAPVSKRSPLSSSSSMIDVDETKPPSLFVVVSYQYDAQFVSSIVQLGGTQVNNNHHEHTKPGEIPVTQGSKVFSAHFRQPYVGLPVTWEFTPLASCTEELYMVPDCCLTDSDVRLHGYKINLRTNELQPIQHPLCSKIHGNVVSLRDGIFFMPSGHWICDARPTIDDAHPILERYNPLKDSWEPRKPFPLDSVDRRNHESGYIVSTAVWDDTILMNIDRQKFWAYNCGNDKWCSVDVVDNDCYDIEGEAVVAENKTIYALSGEGSETILALSVEIEEKKNGDLAYKCSLLSKISAPGMLDIRFSDVYAYRMTMHLVHLGKDNFCLVQSCKVSGCTSQPIQVTYMKNLRGQDKMIVTEIHVHDMQTVDTLQFRVNLCSSLPEGKTTMLKQGKKEPDVFDLDPFPADFDRNVYADSDGSPKRSPSPRW